MKTIQNIADMMICCGCEVCFISCPNKAISMFHDSEGFLYPKINLGCCNECGKCTKVCPILNVDTIKMATHNLSVYAGYMNDSVDLLSCSSGGAATSLSRMVIQNGGVVYGVSYTGNYRSAQYTKAENLIELEAFKGSKYIQAKKGEIYLDILASLVTGKQVLFIGLPCEVGAVKTYLRKDYPNLFTVELICYGPTSPKVSEEYLENIEMKYNSRVSSFSVRYKKGLWTPPYLHAVFENGSEFTEQFYNTDYGHAFSKFTRPSCYSCHYKGDKCVADITIGDYWGCTSNDPFWNSKGVSVIFVHTQKGKDLLSNLPNFHLYSSSYENAILKNPYVCQYRTAAKDRELFSKIFQERGLHAACNETSSKKSILGSAFALMPEFIKPIARALYHKIK